MEPQARESNLSRYLIFFALALPIWIGVTRYVERRQSDYRKQLAAYKAAQAPEETPAPDDPARASEGPSGPSDLAASPTSDTVSPAGDATIAPAESISPASAIVERPTDVEPVIVETKALRVEFSPVGGVPARWQIVHPAYLNADAAEAFRKAKGDEGDGGEGDEAESKDEEAHPRAQPVDLIDPDLEAKAQSRPLEMILKERNSKRFYNELNNGIYEAGPIERGEGYRQIRFTSKTTDSGLQVTKTYRLSEEGFISDFKIEMKNAGTSRLEFDNQSTGLGLTLGPGLGPAPVQEGASGSRMLGGTYFTMDALYMTSEGVKMVAPRKAGQDEILKDLTGAPLGWAGLENRYFFMGLIPPRQEGAQEAADAGAMIGFDRGIARVDPQVVSSGYVGSDKLRFYPRLELYGRPFRLDPGEAVAFDYKIFSGPKEREVLDAAGEDLTRLLFNNSWPINRALSFLLMRMLDTFHSMIGSWGLAIVTLVMLLRILILPLTHYQLKSQAHMMAKQAKLKPELDRINEKHKDNPQKKMQETSKLYKEHNFNPFSMFKGCLPLVIQLPIFFALYRILGQDFALRGASFLWIDDLSEPDKLVSLGFSLPFLGWTHFNLLPTLVALTQVLMSKLSFNPGAISDPAQAAMQKQMMFMMPVMIFVMTYTFPSGLALYWLVSNVWSVLQQQFVNKKILKPAIAAT